MVTQDYRISRMPKVQDLTSPEQLMPALRLMVRREPRTLMEGLALKRGQRVFLVTDQTISPILTEALTIAIREAGGIVNQVSLEGFPDLAEPVELVDTMFGNNWFPNWVWEGAREADVFLHLAFIKLIHIPNAPVSYFGTNPRVIEWELAPDLLLSDWVTFPLDVWDAIDAKTWQLLAGARRIEITDPDGTDLTFELTPEDWARLIKQRRGEGVVVGNLAEQAYVPGRFFPPGHLLLPFPKLRVDGMLATRSLTFGGPVPLTKLTVEGRRVIKVEENGGLGERLQESFERYRDDTSFSAQPGPGCNWISTFGLCTNPKARPSPFYERARGSARVHAWATGHRRSGFLHSGIGSVLLSPTHKNIRHFDMQSPTLKADGRLVVDQGHLMSLDDPEVRKTAEGYGDPDQILREDWIPDRVAAI